MIFTGNPPLHPPVKPRVCQCAVCRDCGLGLPEVGYRVKLNGPDYKTDRINGQGSRCGTFPGKDLRWTAKEATTTVGLESGSPLFSEPSMIDSSRVDPQPIAHKCAVVSVFRPCLSTPIYNICFGRSRSRLKLTSTQRRAYQWLDPFFCLFWLRLFF